MNAALIAACAANACRRNKNKNSISVAGSEIYYKVKIRKYYYFDAVTIVTPDHMRYSGSIYAPIETLMLKPVQLPATTFAVEQAFTVAASKCVNGIDAYVKDNFEYFTSTRLWLTSDNDTFEKYAAKIAKEYGVEVKQGSLHYTTQFHWEVC